MSIIKPLFVFLDFVGWNIFFAKEYSKRTIKQCWKDFNKYYRKK
ncbi:hypothetical protein LCGC14_1617050 [marine sediment metagenome]|uniref:Uncharacterized protein n=1 Tax=marine sediment metagenome TaxID=412755 RepID=A0A0F9ITF3_9ZZZZ